jgi:hypothetical protein
MKGQRCFSRSADSHDGCDPGAGQANIDVLQIVGSGSLYRNVFGHGSVYKRLSD